MIDLHLHLDGSLTIEDIKYLAKWQGIDLEGDSSALKGQLTAPINCDSLDEYLTKFELPLRLLQTRESLAYATEALLLRLRAKGLKYCELRFAPQLHTQKGLSQDEVVVAAIEGLKKSISKDFVAGIILCCMRGKDNYNENIATVKLAEKYRDNGIVGIDLAGAEGLYPTKDFAEVFALARQLSLNITIHAGEADGAESIVWALKMGAKRIGHGVRLQGNDMLIKEIKQRGVGIEMCPTSNLQTKAALTLEGYPLREYLERGLKVSVNSDNMTVSNTTIDDEFRLLFKEYGLTESEQRQLFINAIDMAFADEKVKTWLKSSL